LWSAGHLWAVLGHQAGDQQHQAVLWKPAAVLPAEEPLVLLLLLLTTARAMMEQQQ
jgi:hypothetical protein